VKPPEQGGDAGVNEPFRAQETANFTPLLVEFDECVKPCCRIATKFPAHLLTASQGIIESAEQANLLV
jgi:hypothetical protein